MNLSKLEALHESFPYSEMFWSVFSRIRAEYGDCQNKSPYDKIRTRKIQIQTILSGTKLKATLWQNLDLRT